MRAAATIRRRTTTSSPACLDLAGASHMSIGAWRLAHKWEPPWRQLTFVMLWRLSKLI
jgi:hypothetical protein